MDETVGLCRTECDFEREWELEDVIDEVSASLMLDVDGPTEEMDRTGGPPGWSDGGRRVVEGAGG